MFGAGPYRASDVYLSVTPASGFRWDRDAIFRRPREWPADMDWHRIDAVPVVQDNPLNGPAWPNDSPTVGNLSVVYSVTSAFGS